MLSDEVMEKITERLITRLDDVNLYILKKIAKKLKEIGKLKPTNARQLVQVMQYGGDYDKIVKELAKLTKINVKDIYDIFNEVAKRDYQFAKQFYDYRKKKYIPWEENLRLQNQVNAIAKQTADTYMNLSNTSGIGYMVMDNNGVVTFKDISSTYKDAIDRAILSVSQGETTYQESVYDILNQLGRSGLKYVEYESGRKMRLDSAISMNLREGLKELHNNTQLEFGKQFDSDGVEVSVHIHPAPDHALVQGRQFTNKEFKKFQNDEDSEDVTGRKFPAVSQETGQDRRSISQYNCYHTITSIVIGVSKPIYSDEELQRIIDENEQGFDYEGKHYTLYEGTQLQRKIEREIRTQKDLQILGKESDNEKLTYKSQKKINALTNKYKELSDVSGLRAKRERLRVSGYHKVKVNDNKPTIKYKDYLENYKDDERFNKVVELDEIYTKKYQPIYDKMDDETMNAFKKYSSVYYKDIQRISKGKELDDTDNYIGLGLNNVNDYKKEINKWINKMDKSIENTSIDDNIVLWKGTTDKYYKNLTKEKEFSMGIYNGTSLNRGIAESFMWKKDNAVALKILVPKGTNGMYISGDIGLGELEMLLARNQKYRYIRTYEDQAITDMLKNKKIKIIEIEVVK